MSENEECKKLKHLKIFLSITITCETNKRILSNYYKVFYNDNNISKHKNRCKILKKINNKENTAMVINKERKKIRKVKKRIL